MNNLKDYKNLRLKIYEKDFKNLSKQLKLLEAYILTDEYNNESIKNRESLNNLLRASRVYAAALAESISLLRLDEIYGGHDGK